LAALDDFLNLVLAARAEGAFRHFLQHVVATDRLDDVFFRIIAIFVVLAVYIVGMAFVLMVVALRSSADLVSVFVLMMLMLGVVCVVIVRVIVSRFRRLLLCGCDGLFRIMRMVGMIMVAVIMTFMTIVMAMLIMTVFVVMMRNGMLVFVVTVLVVRMIRRMIADLRVIR
jgi:hypothetical protein